MAISSANCEILIGSVGAGISLTNMLKRIGLREDPWGTPAFGE